MRSLNEYLKELARCVSVSKALPELTVLLEDLLRFLLLGVKLCEKFLLALQNVAYLHLRDSKHLYESLLGPFSVL